MDFIDRDEAIQRIRAGLKRRSGKPWSVTGGRGTAWGWIDIKSPPKRRTGKFGHMSTEDLAELGELLALGKPVHFQGESIPASAEYRQEYVDRAEGNPVSEFGTQYWD